MATSSSATSLDERPNVDNGDRETAEGSTILRTEVGSGLHGIGIAGTDDRDEMGIFIEPREYVTGISTWSYSANRKLHSDGYGMPHYTSRTKPDGVRSGPGDLDLSLYSLRNYARLAAKGNPTVLLPLWAPRSSIVTMTMLGEELRGHREHFLSQHAVHRFLRYMEAQRERMMGDGRQSRVPNRPELIEKYGWDVKYGSHALRLAIQGYDLALEHTLYLPMRPADRELVLEVKTGKVDRDIVNDMVISKAAAVQMLLDQDRTGLPEHPNYGLLNEILDYLHETFWARGHQGRLTSTLGAVRPPSTTIFPRQ